MTAQPLGLLGPVYLMSIAATEDQARAAAQAPRAPGVTQDDVDQLLAEWHAKYGRRVIESTAVTGD